MDLHYSKSQYSFPMEEPFKSWLKCNPTNLPKKMHQTGWCTSKALEKIGAWDSGSHLLAIGNISFIDEGVGQIISLLKAKGLYEDTMIIFTSDHGDYMGQHHMMAKYNHMYDSLARIPLLVKYPGGPQGRDECLYENIDLMPTVLEVCGYDRPATIQGLSLLSDKKKEYVFAEGQYGNDREPYVG